MLRVPRRLNDKLTLISIASGQVYLQSLPKNKDENNFTRQEKLA